MLDRCKLNQWQLVPISPPRPSFLMRLACRVSSAVTGSKQAELCVEMRLSIMSAVLITSVRVLPSPPVGSAFATEHAKLQLQKESLSELRKECTAKR